MIGKRIVVVGVSAAGKTTFARALGRKIQIEPTLMDEIMWNAGWKYAGDESVNHTLSHVAEDQEWLIEGYITKQSRAFLFDRADSIIYLDYGRWRCAYQYLLRVWKHSARPRAELPGSPDVFNLSTLWLVFTKGEAISLNKYLKQVEDQSKILKFSSPRNAKKLLEQYT